jgi:hypothetical protein
VNGHEADAIAVSAMLHPAVEDSLRVREIVTAVVDAVRAAARVPGRSLDDERVLE